MRSSQVEHGKRLELEVLQKETQAEVANLRRQLAPAEERACNSSNRLASIKKKLEDTQQVEWAHQGPVEL